MISNKSVQEIIETARVEEIIQDFITLKRRGVNLIGLCPFHAEKTPSFTVSPSKNIYKCFGCGKGGDSITFLMEHEQLTFVEALRFLANKYGIEIEETVPSQEVIEERQYQDSLFIINQFAQEFYQTQLFESDRGKSIGLSYFKERGFREETIRKFGLGFAPEEKDAFTTKAVGEGYNIDLLRKLGLTSKFDRDFFRGRVMFTIRNLSGKVVAFGGRILVKNVKAPKYINSPETEIYHKSKVLYGAFFAKKAIRKADECILVEGYTDVISLHQEGIENVVASSGTSLTIEQIRLVKRYTPNIKILYDGDLAGTKAALRGLDLVLEQDLNVKIVMLPDGEDPDSYLQKVGITSFKTYIEQEAQDFIRFKTNLLLKEAGDDPIKKTAVIKDIVSSIARIPDPLKRSLFVKVCAKAVQVEEQLLVNEINKIVATRLKKKRQEKELASAPEPVIVAGVDVSAPPDEEHIGVPPPASKAIGDEFQEKDIIRILMTGGGAIFNQEENLTVGTFLINNIEDVIDEFDNKLYQKIAQEALEKIKKKEVVDVKYFLNHSDPEIKALAINFSTSPYEYSENWEKRWDIFLTTQKMPDENFIKDSEQGLKRFKLRKIIRLCNLNQKLIKEHTETGNMEQVITYLKVQQKLIEMRNALAKELGTVVF